MREKKWIDRTERERGGGQTEEEREREGGIKREKNRERQTEGERDE